MLANWLTQLAQVLFVLGFAPLLRGLLERYKARLAGRPGPPVWQPYRDLRKWWHKETVRTQSSTWIAGFAPVTYFLAPLVVTLLIPALTAFPLPLAWMGDMLAGGMILGAGGLSLLLAALDAGSVYPALGVSRIRLIGVFTEPLALLVVFGAASAAGATIPFVVNRTLTGPAWRFSPTHVLLVVAWFLLLIAETGRIPVDNPSSTQELSLIDPARTFEASGPDLVFYEWGGWMKFVVLSLILVNVLLTPWGLATRAQLGAVLAAMVLVGFKMLLLGLFLVTVEAGFAKLRLLRNVDFVAVGIMLAALGAVGALFSL
ncbi:MAG: NADH-quinone oxidoreductase subunit H [Firmicutes bacterium]|nr:NADH-quinone oxidoreductase subunit H [Bacillota bacterium]